MRIDFTRLINSELFELPPEDESPEQKLQFLINQCLPGLLQIKILQFTPELCRAEIAWSKSTSGLHGLMHGGTLYAAADTLTALMVLLHFGPDTETVVTKNGSIKYLRPVSEGKINVTARIISKDNKNFRLVADCVNPGNKRVAQAKFDCILIDKISENNKPL